MSLSSVRLAIFGVLTLGACNNFDTSRDDGPKVSVGTQVFGVVCDRTVAQNFPEDVGGTRFDRLCHPGADGRFGNPPETPAETLANPSAETTRLAYARVRALAARRADLIRAFDVMFPNDDPGFLDGLQSLLAKMSPLYDEEVPAMLKSLDQVIVNLQQSEDAVNGLTRILNREGYRPQKTAAGLMAAFANQPEFATFVDASLRVLAPGGQNDNLLNQVLEASKDWLKDVNARGGTSGSLISDALLVEDEELFQAGEETFITRRNACGFASFNAEASVMSQLGAATAACPSMDKYGRFLDTSGSILPLPTPFTTLSPFADRTHRDQWDRALDPSGKTIFNYVSVNKTALAGILASSRGLFDPKRPVATDLLANFGPVFGDLSAKVTSQGATTRRYDIYTPESAPAMDLALAAQPLIKALGENDFESLDVLARAFKRDDVVGARVLVALSSAKDLANADTSAVYDPKSSFWDDILDILSEAADTPAITKDGQTTTLLGELLAAFGHPNVVGLSTTLSELMSFNDETDYNPTDINAPAVNVTTGSSDNTPRTPVDRRQPDMDMNRSLFMRLAQLIHETNGVPLCNKQSPSILSASGPCELFFVDNMAKFFLQSIVVNNNPSEAWALAQKDASGKVIGREPGQFPFAIATVSGMSPAAQFGGDFLAGNSGINGMTLYPTPEALARVLFRREPDSFFDSIQNAAPTALCPRAGLSGDLYEVRDCKDTPLLTLRARHRGTIFAFETTGFYDAIRPIARPFVKFGREDLFLRVMSAVTQAWPSKKNTQCDQVGGTTNPTFCTRSNLVSYEPLLAKIFSPEVDVIPSLHEFVRSIENAEPGATAKLAPMLRAAFSRELNSGLRDRQQFGTSDRNGDGPDNNYVTPATLFVKAMNDIDAKRKQDAAGLNTWLKARSAFVDTIFAYDRPSGEVTLTRLKNAAVAKALPSFLSAVANELRARKTDGRFNELVGGGFVADARDAIASPVLYAGLQTIKLLQQDDTAAKALLATAYGALNPDNLSSFIASAASLGDLVQSLNDTTSIRPILPALAPAFDPIADTSRNTPGAFKAALGLLAETSKLDTDHRLTVVIKNAVSTMPSGARTPIDIISDTVTEVSRTDPSKDQPFTADDTRRILSETRAFLGDDQNGFKRIVNIIQKRNIETTK